MGASFIYNIYYMKFLLYAQRVRQNTSLKKREGVFYTPQKLTLSLRIIANAGLGLIEKALIY